MSGSRTTTRSRAGGENVEEPERDYLGNIICHCAGCDWCKSLEDSAGRTIYFCMNADSTAYTSPPRGRKTRINKGAFRLLVLAFVPSMWYNFSCRIVLIPHLLRVDCGGYREVDIIPRTDNAERAVKGRRGKRQRVSEPKQKDLNEKNSKRYLVQLGNGNFGAGDLHVTLTYSAKHLPWTVGGAERRSTGRIRFRELLHRFFPFGFFKTYLQRASMPFSLVWMRSALA